MITENQVSSMKDTFEKHTQNTEKNRLLKTKEEKIWKDKDPQSNLIMKTVNFLNDKIGFTMYSDVDRVISCN